MAPERPPPAFEGAGQESGLQVWRVERLELVTVPPSRHGDFFVGDAYLVLHTVRRGAAAAYRLHYWLGRVKSCLCQDGEVSYLCFPQNFILAFSLWCC
uniref:Uncharacterized protein n=1 Tax=Pavo cristatus TaxID=9049 RepID=A0A8C9FHM3_PAVCR